MALDNLHPTQFRPTVLRRPIDFIQRCGVAKILDIGIDVADIDEKYTQILIIINDDVGTRAVETNPPGAREIISRQIGTILAKQLIPLAMAHAEKLEKFGA